MLPARYAIDYDAVLSAALSEGTANAAQTLQQPPRLATGRRTRIGMRSDSGWRTVAAIRG